MLTGDRVSILFRLGLCSKNRPCPLQRPSENQNRRLGPRQTLRLPTVRALLLLFLGRHSKSLEIIKITSLLARARGRSVKIVEINVLVARVWGTSAKHRCPGLEKYAYRNQKRLLDTTNFYDFDLYFDLKCSLSRSLQVTENM